MLQVAATACAPSQILKCLRWHKYADYAPLITDLCLYDVGQRATKNQQLCMPNRRNRCTGGNSNSSGSDSHIRICITLYDFSTAQRHKIIQTCTGKPSEKFEIATSTKYPVMETIRAKSNIKYISLSKVSLVS